MAMALLLFGHIYELLIGELSVPAWMKIHDLHDLKTRLGSILVLVMAVKFLEKLAVEGCPGNTLLRPGHNARLGRADRLWRLPRKGMTHEPA